MNTTRTGTYGITKDRKEMTNRIASRREATDPYSASLVPTIYGNTPSFMGSQPVRNPAELRDLDAVVAGLPWEGTNTWGSWSGCEQTPKACRSASLRYGAGYLPEYDIAVTDHVRLGDLGDLPTHPNDTAKTFAGFEMTAAEIFAAGVVPVFIGGDHSVSYPILKALSTQRPGRVGIIHFDSHLDNADEYGGDTLARCCPLRRIAELPGIDPARMVHFGIRGPRNSRSQMNYARERGIPVITGVDVRRHGLREMLERALQIASDGTDGYYVTVCSDILDHAFNPGGAIDFGGLSSGEMFDTLYTLGQGKMLGLDLVEVYPRSDLHETSVHMLVWLAIYALADCPSDWGAECSSTQWRGPLQRRHSGMIFI